MRKKRLSLNIITSFMLEVVQVISSFILPRLIISTYGSDVNGLVSSLGQFLSTISLLEFGVGAVIRSALYKPLADRDSQKINEIMSSANRFYRRIGNVLLIYTGGLIVVYPTFINNSFGFKYTVLLIAALFINSFSQYYFSCIDGLLISSDQRSYISASLSIISMVLNTVVCVLLIKAGASIQTVKFVGSAVFVLRAVILHYYVKNKYSLNYHTKYVGEPLEQKWNAVAQHIANYVLQGTDIMVLTLFSTLEYVSVYSVYILVINGIKQLFVSLSEGFQSLLGEYYVKQDQHGLKKTFDLMEWFYGTFTTFVYGCTAFLIVPFVRLYTKGVADVDYLQPRFALIIVIAFWIFSNNTPYHRAILAAGHYRQTQTYFAIAAAINVFVSLVMVKLYGLIGVAVGTLLAMLFQTTWMIIYNIKHISKRPVQLVLKQILVDGATILIASVLSLAIRFDEVSWAGWITMGFKIAFIWGGVSLAVNLVFYFGPAVLKNKKKDQRG